ncbi:MAG: amidohydrolase family protein [Opitutaceae bacterium]
MKAGLSAISRREFLQAATSAAAATALPRLSAATTDDTALIDTNISLGAWPFRRCPLEGARALVAKLREHGVTQAWAGSLDALLHKDVSAVNARLAEECRRHGGGLLVPIGALNPRLPGWEEEMRRCVEIYHTPGIRLHPNYHGYGLDDPLFERVLARAAERGLFVQIVTTMEDERTIHPLVNVPATDAAPLAGVLERNPAARVQLLNAWRTLRGASDLVRALAARRVRFEIAMLEGIEGVAKLLKQLPPDRLCFGSHAPIFYFESALLKLRESALEPAQLRAVRAAAAQSLLSHA